MNYLIKQANVINEGRQRICDVYIQNGRIEKIDTQIDMPSATEINAEGLWLIPGAIDDQVHFREPGLTHKADIHTESRAAVAGGVTSFMEMPNTKPPTLSQELLEEKYERAAQVSLANYSFFMGVSNDNIEEVLRTNDKKHSVCGIKIFMGSSTGNMLVDNYLTLDKIFGETELLIATHCEDENIIATNMRELEKILNPEEWQAHHHPVIRNDIACFESSFSAVQLAKRHNARLHILHISTEKELQLFSNMLPLKDKKITAEVCVHHLSFTSDHYSALGNQIKCNPAIKKPSDKKALWEALNNDTLDVIATDHAPHTWDEKFQKYIHAPSGLPLVQHSVLMMLEHARNGKITVEKVVQKMCHAPADLFAIEERGYIREGYHADMVLVNPHAELVVDKSNILYKCGWSPLEGKRFTHEIMATFVNGNKVYEKGNFDESNKGQRLTFQRL